MSSTMAKASRNTLSDGTTLFPTNDITPTARAMSVAMGMPQPRTHGPPELKANKRGRYDHPSKGGDYGKHPAMAIPQFAFDHFSFDFESNDEEKDRHQALVQPMPNVHAQDREPSRNSKTADQIR